MNNHAPELQAFAGIADAFCAWAEAGDPRAITQRDAGIWLARLHACALALPDVGPENSIGAPDFAMQAARAAASFAPLVGWLYRTVDDLEPVCTEEPGLGDLGDDLLDIYKDVKSGLLHWQLGQLPNALWHWSYLHRIHWGTHAVNALSALHANHVVRQEPNAA